MNLCGSPTNLFEKKYKENLWEEISKTEKKKYGNEKKINKSINRSINHRMNR